MSFLLTTASSIGQPLNVHRLMMMMGLIAAPDQTRPTTIGDVIDPSNSQRSTTDRIIGSTIGIRTNERERIRLTSFKN